MSQVPAATNSPAIDIKSASSQKAQAKMDDTADDQHSADGHELTTSPINKGKQDVNDGGDAIDGQGIKSVKQETRATEHSIATLSKGFANMALASDPDAGTMSEEMDADGEPHENSINRTHVDNNPEPKQQILAPSSSHAASNNTSDTTGTGINKANQSTTPTTGLDNTDHPTSYHTASTLPSSGSYPAAPRIPQVALFENFTSAIDQNTSKQHTTGTMVQPVHLPKFVGTPGSGRGASKAVHVDGTGKEVAGKKDKGGKRTLLKTLKTRLTVKKKESKSGGSDS